MQMLCTNMLFETRLGPKGSSAGATTIPFRHALAGLDVKLAADKLFLLGMNVALVDLQVSFFRKAPTTAWMVADIVPALVDAAMMNVHVSLEMTIRSADFTALIAGRGMHSLDVLLHFNIGRKTDGRGKDGGVQARVELSHLW